MRSSFLEPLKSHGTALGNTYAKTKSIHDAEAELGNGVTLFSDFSEPFSGLGVVLRNAFTSIIPDAETELSIGAALFSGFLEPFNGFGIVLRNAIPFVIPDTEAELRIGITLFGTFLQRGDVQGFSMERCREQRENGGQCFYIEHHFTE